MKKRNFEDEVGKTYNYLTVESEAEPELKSGHRQRRWNFKCQCGVIKSLPPNNVFKGNTKSCGCMKSTLCKEKSTKYRRDSKVDYPVERRLYTMYKGKNKDFHLTFEHFLELVNGNCNYCGVEPNTMRYSLTTISKRDRADKKLLNGVDRLDSSIGYVKENVTSCCKTCNYMKGSLSVEEFLNQVSKINSN